MTRDHNADDPATAHRALGGVALYLGLALFGLALVDGMFGGLPFNLPRTWYLHRPLWILFILGLIAAGWKLQRHGMSHSRPWKPTQPGRRFERLVVYSRPDCHLCDDAKAVLAEYADYLPEIEDIDIDADPQLQARFGTTIPVIELDGEIRFRGHVDETLLRRLIEGTPPM